ncbi:MAG TPA: hypothetical protein IAC20_02400 [Candidatus Faecisoma merdavium]|nr:hypothetical protein [Candidatus Faecisoma merdavium]
MDSKDKVTKKRSIVKTIFDVVFWIVIIGLAIVWITDFINVQNDKNPVFCLKNETHKYDDGTVEECIGLGYKVYTYDRSSFSKGRQFGPFFIGMREN